MGVEIVTKNDLEQFRVQLLHDLRALLLKQSAPEKIWLRSVEVRKMLKISPNTLQNLRVKNKLHPAKIGGIFYYNQDEIDILLNQNRG